MARRSLLCCSLLAISTVALGLVLSSEPAGAEKKAAVRFFEMRTYTTNDGKLDALHSRFRDHTNPLFKKHGMELVAYWTPTDEKTAKNTLIYVLAYPSLEAREKAWKGFVNDPAWKKAYAASIKDGRLVKKVESEYMVPTDYSPMK